MTANIGQTLYWDPVTMTAGVSNNMGSFPTDVFKLVNFGSSYVYSNLLNSYVYKYLGDGNGHVPAKLGAGAAIDSNTSWTGAGWGYMDKPDWTTAHSPWATGQDGTTGNIPFKFRKNVAPTATYYGWANITYNDVAHTLVLNNFAYNDTPNASITPGVVPEPSSMLLLAMGGTTVLAARRRRRDSQASVAVAS